MSKFPTWHEQVLASAEEKAAALRDTVIRWTGERFDFGLEYNPELLLELFLDRYPEWNEPEFIDTIIAEFERTWTLCTQSMMNEKSNVETA